SNLFFTGSKFTYQENQTLSSYYHQFEFEFYNHDQSTSTNQDDHEKKTQTENPIKNKTSNQPDPQPIQKFPINLDFSIPKDLNLLFIIWILLLLSKRSDSEPISVFEPSRTSLGLITTSFSLHSNLQSKDSSTYPSKSFADLESTGFTCLESSCASFD
ncbi:uncharacterized protein MELLADRAFT_77375, partial [Melampsora larici-populina 98AG31]